METKEVINVRVTITGIVSKELIGKVLELQQAYSIDDSMLLQDAMRLWIVSTNRKIGAARAQAKNSKAPKKRGPYKKKPKKAESNAK